jgi:hypothetical protein
MPPYDMATAPAPIRSKPITITILLRMMFTLCILKWDTSGLYYAQDGASPTGSTPLRIFRSRIRENSVFATNLEV